MRETHVWTTIYKRKIGWQWVVCMVTLDQDTEKMEMKNLWQGWFPFAALSDKFSNMALLLASTLLEVQHRR